MVMILTLTLAQESSVAMTLMKVSIGYGGYDKKWFAMFHSKMSTRTVRYCTPCSKRDGLQNSVSQRFQTIQLQPPSDQPANKW